MSFTPIVEECSKDLNEAKDKEKLLINEIINNPAFAIILGSLLLPLDVLYEIL